MSAAAPRTSSAYRSGVRSSGRTPGAVDPSVVVVEFADPDPASTFIEPDVLRRWVRLVWLVVSPDTGKAAHLYFAHRRNRRRRKGLRCRQCRSRESGVSTARRESERRIDERPVRPECVGIGSPCIRDESLQRWPVPDFEANLHNERAIRRPEDGSVGAVAISVIRATLENLVGLPACGGEARGQRPPHPQRDRPVSRLAAPASDRHDRGERGRRSRDQSALCMPTNTVVDDPRGSIPSGRDFAPRSYPAADLVVF